jgi:hypothetical protein
MPANWDQLRHQTAAAQISFLDAEVDTGITLARIALRAKDGGKISRNTRSARKAYDTLRAYLANVPPETPGLDGVRKKMTILTKLLEKLGDKR